ncbi:MAG: hypothetical protein IPP68_03020 [Elusimicrobia bacterium]|nr:hypothetical protein [Elusimicrobiota bacterium]
MPDADLSPAVPPTARWVKLQYQLKAKTPGARLTARVWSGAAEGAVALQGPEGFAFVRLSVPQRLSYQAPADVEIKLKVIAFKDGGVSPAGHADSK